MEVILGKSAGFCYGVKRAVDGAKIELKKSKGKKLYFFFWSDLIAGESRSVSYTFFYER